MGVFRKWLKKEKETTDPNSLVNSFTRDCCKCIGKKIQITVSYDGEKAAYEIEGGYSCKEEMNHENFKEFYNFCKNTARDYGYKVILIYEILS